MFDFLIHNLNRKEQNRIYVKGIGPRLGKRKNTLEMVDQISIYLSIYLSQLGRYYH